MQNIIVLGIGSILYFVPAAFDYVKGNPWVPIMAGVLFVGVVVPIFFLRGQPAMQAMPWSIVSLSAFIATEALLVGAVCVVFQSWTLLWVMAINAVVLTACSFFACQNRFNFNPIMGLLIIAFCGLLFIGSVVSILGISFGGILWAAIISVVYTGVVVVHTEMTMSALVDAKTTKPPTLVLTETDASAMALKLNIDIVAVVPFLYGIFVMCCGKKADAKRS
jgi:FtsH-binding integral membrane protein